MHTVSLRMHAPEVLEKVADSPQGSKKWYGTTTTHCNPWTHRGMWFWRREGWFCAMWSCSSSLAIMKCWKRRRLTCWTGVDCEDDNKVESTYAFGNKVFLVW